MKPSSRRGFTLVELLAVMAIVGLLLASALPAYRAYTEKTAVFDARNKLVELMHLQNRHFSEQLVYTLNLAEDFGNAALTSERGHYRIEARACNGNIASCVRLSAVPERADRTPLTLDSQGNRTPLDLWR